MTVNVMASNDGPLFVAYDDNGDEAGELTITSSGITLQLYGQEAVFAGDFTGSFRQLSICIHDGVAELYEDCSSEGTRSFIVNTNDVISQLTFGQSLSSNDTEVFQVNSEIPLSVLTYLHHCLYPKGRCSTTRNFWLL